MLFNRTLIKPIFQTSKLNREKFVIKKMSSSGASFYGGGGGGGPNWVQSIIYMFIVAVSCNISSKLIKNTNSKQE
jgi:hypothetical protein